MAQESDLLTLRDEDTRQAAFLEAIGLSAEIAGQSYDRLFETLLALANDSEALRATAIALSEAWQLVDSGHRLRSLIRQMPGLKNSRPRKELLESLNKAEPLRNYIQHLDRELATASENPRGLTWGSLSWVRVHDDLRGATIYSLAKGSIRRNPTTDLMNPMGQNVVPPIDLITLFAGPHSVCLSTVMRSIVDFHTRLGDGLPPEVRRHLRPEGMLAQIHIGFTDTEGRPVTARPAHPDVPI